MQFVWDEHKNKANLRKHKVSFETAKLVFEDPMHFSIQDRYEANEDRWQTIGLVKGVVLLLVAHTMEETPTDEVIRIISARKATKAESKRYEQVI